MILKLHYVEAVDLYFRVIKVYNIWSLNKLNSSSVCIVCLWRRPLTSTSLCFEIFWAFVASPSPRVLSSPCCLRNAENTIGGNKGGLSALFTSEHLWFFSPCSGSLRPVSPGFPALEIRYLELRSWIFLTKEVTDLNLVAILLLNNNKELSCLLN